MIDEDYDEFVGIVNRDCERRGKPYYSGGLLEEMFEDLEDLTLEQVKYAAKCHRRSDAGMYALSVANIRKQLGLKNVQDLTKQDVVVMAKQKNTPLAIIASRYIKSHDLEHKSDVENWGQAELFLSDLPGIVARLERGEMTEHEIVLCGKYGVNPLLGIHIGHDVLPCRPVLESRIETAKAGRNWALMLEEKREKANTAPLLDNPEGRKRIAQELRPLLADVQNKPISLEEAKKVTGIE